MSSKDYVFFLGGNDLEMQTIRELLAKHSTAQIYDKNLAWGAVSSDYKAEIQQTLAEGKTPVLIELSWDTPELPKDNVYILDHHNQLAGAHQATPLQQVFALLNLSQKHWTRHYDLVVANDKAHIKGMLDMGATRKEIITIRKADRAAQGVTEKDEQLAHQAIANKQTLHKGQLFIVNSKTDKTSPVADLLAPELSPQNASNLLIISPHEINFYGNGNIVGKLSKEQYTGWYGGNLPFKGFWGSTQLNKTENVMQCIAECLQQPKIETQ